MNAGRFSLVKSIPLGMHYRSLIFGTLCFALLHLIGCKHEVPSPNFPPGSEVIESTECDPDTVYFQQDILPLLASSCAMPDCHDVASHEDGIILDSYANILFGDDDNLVVPGSLGASELYEVITEDDPDKIMPPPPATPLSSDQISTIATWIQQGALNNSCSSCDTSQFTYSAIIAPIMQNNCTACHGGSAPDAGLDLTTHAGVSSAASYLQLTERVSHAPGFDPMPPTGDGLSTCQVTQIENWINAGMPNN